MDARMFIVRRFDAPMWDVGRCTSRWTLYVGLHVRLFGRSDVGCGTLHVGRCWTLLDFVGLWTLGRWTLDVGCWLGRWLLVIADMPSVHHNLFYPYVDYHIRLPGRILPRINLLQRIYTTGENRASRLKAANHGSHRDP